MCPGKRLAKPVYGTLGPLPSIQIDISLMEQIDQSMQALAAELPAAGWEQ